jgi:hypothetical protein
MIVLVDVGPHFEHVKLIRYNIKPNWVKKCRNVQNKPILRKKQRAYLGPHGQPPPYILESVKSVLKT